MIQLFNLFFFILSLVFCSNSWATGCSNDGYCYVIYYTQTGSDYTSDYYSAHSVTYNGCEPTDFSIGGQNNYNYPAHSYTVITFKWNGSSWDQVQYKSNLWVIDTNYNLVIGNLIEHGAINTDPRITYPNGFPGCGSSCSTKTGNVTYDLKQYDNPDSPPVAGNVCYEDCQQSAEILWNDCLAGSCVASVKYTATGESCGVETSVENLQTDPPDRCTDQINEKIAQCGGSLKVLSFDFESCTGECTPDACGDQWTELVNRCGGIMAVSSWNAETCSGSCANDPLPDPQDPTTEAVPEEVKKETVINPDGTSQVTTTTTYNVNNVEYTKTTTTTYDSDGNETGTTTSTSTSPSGGDSSGDDDGEDETFSSIAGSSGFGTAYTPGSYDIPGRFSSFLQNVKSSGLFSFSSSFFNSLPSGGSSELVIDGGQTFGSHIFDFSQSFGGGLAILKSVLLILFGFLSIRAIIMKR